MRDAKRETGQFEDFPRFLRKVFISPSTAPHPCGFEQNIHKYKYEKINP